MAQLILKTQNNMKNIKQLQNRLKAAEAEIAEVRRLMQEEESKSKPPKWEDLGEVEGYYINAICDIISSENKATCSAANTFPTKEQAAASLAEAKLLQLRDSKFYRNGWKPNWNDSTTKFVLIYSSGKLCVATSISYLIGIWSFQDYKTAERFLNEQSELLEIWVKKIRS